MMQTMVRMEAGATRLVTALRSIVGWSTIELLYLRRVSRRLQYYISVFQREFVQHDASRLSIRSAALCLVGADLPMYQ